MKLGWKGAAGVIVLRLLTLISEVGVRGVDCELNPASDAVGVGGECVRVMLSLLPLLSRKR